MQGRDNVWRAYGTQEEMYYDPKSRRPVFGGQDKVRAQRIGRDRMSQQWNPMMGDRPASIVTGAGERQAYQGMPYFNYGPNYYDERGYTTGGYTTGRGALPSMGMPSGKKAPTPIRKHVTYRTFHPLNADGSQGEPIYTPRKHQHHPVTDEAIFANKYGLYEPYDPSEMYIPTLEDIVIALSTIITLEHWQRRPPWLERELVSHNPALTTWSKGKTKEYEMVMDFLTDHAKSTDAAYSNGPRFKAEGTPKSKALQYTYLRYAYYEDVDEFNRAVEDLKEDPTPENVKKVKQKLFDVKITGEQFGEGRGQVYQTKYTSNYWHMGEKMIDINKPGLWYNILEDYHKANELIAKYELSLEAKGKKALKFDVNNPQFKVPPQESPVQTTRQQSFKWSHGEPKNVVDSILRSNELTDSNKIKFKKFLEHIKTKAPAFAEAIEKEYAKQINEKIATNTLEATKIKESEYKELKEKYKTKDWFLNELDRIENEHGDVKEARATADAKLPSVDDYVKAAMEGDKKLSTKEYQQTYDNNKNVIEAKLRQEVLGEKLPSESAPKSTPEAKPKTGLDKIRFEKESIVEYKNSLGEFKEAKEGKNIPKYGPAGDVSTRAEYYSAQPHQYKGIRDAYGRPLRAGALQSGLQDIERQAFWDALEEENRVRRSRGQIELKPYEFESIYRERLAMQDPLYRRGSASYTDSYTPIDRGYQPEQAEPMRQQRRFPNRPFTPEEYARRAAEIPTEAEMLAEQERARQQYFRDMELEEGRAEARGQLRSTYPYEQAEGRRIIAAEPTDTPPKYRKQTPSTPKQSLPPEAFPEIDPETGKPRLRTRVEVPLQSAGMEGSIVYGLDEIEELEDFIEPEPSEKKLKITQAELEVLLEQDKTELSQFKKGEKTYILWNKDLPKEISPSKVGGVSQGSFPAILDRIRAEAQINFITEAEAAKRLDSYKTLSVNNHVELFDKYNQWWAEEPKRMNQFLDLRQKQYAQAGMETPDELKRLINMSDKERLTFLEEHSEKYKKKQIASGRLKRRRSKVRSNQMAQTDIDTIQRTDYAPEKPKFNVEADLKAFEEAERAGVKRKVEVDSPVKDVKRIRTFERTKAPPTRAMAPLHARYDPGVEGSKAWWQRTGLRSRPPIEAAREISGPAYPQFLQGRAMRPLRAVAEGVEPVLQAVERPLAGYEGAVTSRELIRDTPLEAYDPSLYDSRFVGEITPSFVAGAGAGVKYPGPAFGAGIGAHYYAAPFEQYMGLTPEQAQWAGAGVGLAATFNPYTATATYAVPVADLAYQGGTAFGERYNLGAYLGQKYYNKYPKPKPKQIEEEEEEREYGEFGK